MIAQSFLALGLTAALAAVRPVVGVWERRGGVSTSLPSKFAFLLIAGAVGAIAIHLSDASWVDLGFGPVALGRVLLVTLIGTVALVCADLFAARLLLSRPSLLRQRTSALSAWLGDVERRRPLLVIYIVASGLYEEVVFRGLAFHFTRGLGVADLVALPLLALIFGLQHTGSGRTGIFYSFTYGLYFGLTYLAAGSLAAPVIAHALGNGCTLLWTYPRLVRRAGVAGAAPAFMF